MSSAAVKRMKFEDHLKFTFEITNFRTDAKNPYLSERFYMSAGRDQTKWRVKVHCNNGKKLEVGVFFVLLSDHEVNVGVSFKIIDPNDHVVESSESTKCFVKDTSYGRKFDGSVLTKALSSDNVFRVICEIQLIENLNFHPFDLNTSAELKTAISSGDFYDLKVQVGTNKNIILGHKLILAAYSPVLAEEIKEIKCFSTALQIDEFEWDTINSMINFLHKNEVNLDESNAEEILLAANKYKISTLQARCEKYYIDHLTIENALDTLTAIDRFCNKKLFHKTVNYIKENIRAVMKMKERWEKFIHEYPTYFRILFDKIFLNLSLKLAKKFKPNDDDDDTASTRTELIHNTLSSDYKKLYKTMKHADVVFEVDGKILSAHKAILSCRSPVFDAMFNHDSLEAKENRIKIVDFDYETVQGFLKFIYCGRAGNLNNENAFQLYTIADKYDSKELKKVCKTWMEKNVTLDNVLEILKLADLHLYLKNLKKMAFNCIFKNFEKGIPKWNSFAIQNPTILQDLLEMILKVEDRL